MGYNRVSAKPVFVPIVLPLQEAEATALALRVAFDNVATMRPPGFSEEELRQVKGVYARAMVAVAEAVDKAREKAAAAPPEPPLGEPDERTNPTATNQEQN